jgi:hypothetical protein
MLRLMHTTSDDATGDRTEMTVRIKSCENIITLYIGLYMLSLHGIRHCCRWSPTGRELILSRASAFRQCQESAHTHNAMPALR